MTVITKGYIMDEFGEEKVGWFAYRQGQGNYTIHWLGIELNGYTWEGLNRWAIDLGYQLWY